MGEVTRRDGFKVMVYSNDHEPAHVHVISADAEIRILLDDECTVIEIEGKIIGKKIRQARELVVEHREACMTEWKRGH